MSEGIQQDIMSVVIHKDDIVFEITNSKNRKSPHIRENDLKWSMPNNG